MKNIILLVCGMQLWRHLPLSSGKVPTPPILRQPFCQLMGHNIGTIYLALLLRPFRVLWKTAITSNQPAESSCGIRPRLAVARLSKGLPMGRPNFPEIS
jgi:dolichol kinase